MKPDPKKVGSMLQNYPLKDLMFSLAKGIVDSQRELDEISVQSLNAALQRTITNSDGKSANLIELGLVPNFYQFESATIKVSVEIKMGFEETTEKSTSTKIQLGGAASASPAPTTVVNTPGATTTTTPVVTPAPKTTTVIK